MSKYDQRAKEALAEHKKVEEEYTDSAYSVVSCAMSKAVLRNGLTEAKVFSYNAAGDKPDDDALRFYIGGRTAVTYEDKEGKTHSAVYVDRGNIETILYFTYKGKSFTVSGKFDTYAEKNDDKWYLKNGEMLMKYVMEKMNE